MARIVLMSLPFSSGHINPTIEIVKELVQRGNEVIYYSTGHYKMKIRQTGAVFREYESSVHDLCWLAGQEKVNNFMLLAEGLKTCRAVIPGLQKQLKREHVDLVLHEFLCPWGKIVAQELGVPAASYLTTFVLNEKTMPFDYKFKLFFESVKGMGYVNEIKQVAKELESLYHVKCSNVFEVLDNTQPVNLVFTSRYFQPDDELLDDRFKFIGPAIGERREHVDFPMERLDGQKVIYISLGTVFNYDLEFYRMCIEAFRDFDGIVVMSVGKKVDLRQFKGVPGNFIIKNYVPQLEVLERAQLFITHGGMNSVSEALYFGVPLIIIPKDADQPIVANRVRELGAGVFVKRQKLNARVLWNLATQILQDPVYNQNVQAIGESFRESGGALRGAEEIKEFIELSRVGRSIR